MLKETLILMVLDMLAVIGFVLAVWQFASMAKLPYTHVHTFSCYSADEELICEEEAGVVQYISTGIPSPVDFFVSICNTASMTIEFEENSLCIRH